jgi:AcrR family transcriptional regulator
MGLSYRGYRSVLVPELSHSPHSSKLQLPQPVYRNNLTDSASIGSIRRRQNAADQGAGMPNALHSRKQELVRDAIFDAAIDLFARKGFDETTLKDVSKAAGVSPRTLYRYFATRDELLAHGNPAYGRVLVSAFNDSPLELSPLKTIRRAATAAAAYSTSRPRMREIIQISSTRPSVRQAQQVGMVLIQSQLSEAFSARIRNGSRDDLKPRMYASATIAIAGHAIHLWFRGDCMDATSAVNQVMRQMSRLFCEG